MTDLFIKLSRNYKFYIDLKQIAPNSKQEKQHSYVLGFCCRCCCFVLFFLFFVVVVVFFFS